MSEDSFGLNALLLAIQNVIYLNGNHLPHKIQVLFNSEDKKKGIYHFPFAEFVCVIDWLTLCSNFIQFL